MRKWSPKELSTYSLCKVFVVIPVEVREAKKSYLRKKPRQGSMKNSSHSWEFIHFLLLILACLTDIGPTRLCRPIWDSLTTTGEENRNGTWKSRREDWQLWKIVLLIPSKSNRSDSFKFGGSNSKEILSIIFTCGKQWNSSNLKYSLDSGWSFGLLIIVCK